MYKLRSAPPILYIYIAFIFLSFSSRNLIITMADWGLQAVIRPKDQYDEDHHHNNNHHHHQYHEHDACFGSIDMKKEYDQALLFCFPHLFDQANTSTMETVVAGAGDDQLDQLYKPFCPPVYFTKTTDFVPAAPDQETQKDQEQEIQKICGSASITSQVAPKLKKRKNQQKRVVVQVTADGLSSDPWAWRKYGQKPIKGSIYPRSYYRCSSSKACLARRQVEQSCTDSSIYILTYTAEHNHTQPTRRNSLAGINRSRYKATPKSPTSSDGGKTVTKSKDSSFHSPTSGSSTEDEILSHSIVKQETLFYNKCDNQGHMTTTGSINDDDDYMVFSDDFFAGLEDLGGYKTEPSSYDLSNEQFPCVFS